MQLNQTTLKRLIQHIYLNGFNDGAFRIKVEENIDLNKQLTNELTYTKKLIQENTK